VSPVGHSPTLALGVPSCATARGVARENPSISTRAAMSAPTLHRHICDDFIDDDSFALTSE
jgi:hypothetical protein